MRAVFVIVLSLSICGMAFLTAPAIASFIRFQLALRRRERRPGAAGHGSSCRPRR
jgi:hypothetical protein